MSILHCFPLIFSIPILLCNFFVLFGAFVCFSGWFLYKFKGVLFRVFHLVVHSVLRFRTALVSSSATVPFCAAAIACLACRRAQHFQCVAFYEAFSPCVAPGLPRVHPTNWTVGFFFPPAGGGAETKSRRKTLPTFAMSMCQRNDSQCWF